MISHVRLSYFIGDILKIIGNALKLDIIIEGGCTQKAEEFSAGLRLECITYL